MENKNRVLVIGLLTLIVGLLVGYYFGVNKALVVSQTQEESEKHETIDDHMDEIVANDGAMQHAMEEMMLEFRGKTGVEFEKAFLEGMIVHHLGAVEMAEQLLDNTERPELVQMANDIISVQSDEIDMMKGWLNAWFN